MTTLLIQKGRVFDGEKFIWADVLIRNGKIEATAPNIREKADRIIDASGMKVLPGLVDVHLHMQGISSPGWCIDAKKGSFPHGVTAAADASAGYGDQNTLDSLGLQAGVFVITGTKEPFSFEKALQRLEKYGDRVLGIKVCYDQKFDPTLADEKKLVAICEFAHSRGLPVVVHTANSPVPMDILLSVLAPGDIATHVLHGGRHHAGEDRFACLKKAKKRGIWLDSCICAGEHVDFALFGQAIAAGIYPDLMGTDLAEEIAHRSGGYGLTTCMSAARVLGMPEEAIFRAVTGNAGKALGKNTWGILKEGGPANVALLQWGEGHLDLSDRYGHRLASKEAYCCRMTICNGRIVFEREN